MEAGKAQGSHAAPLPKTPSHSADEPTRSTDGADDENEWCMVPSNNYRQNDVSCGGGFDRSRIATSKLGWSPGYHSEIEAPGIASHVDVSLVSKLHDWDTQHHVSLARLREDVLQQRTKASFERHKHTEGLSLLDDGLQSILGYLQITTAELLQNAPEHILHRLLATLHSDIAMVQNHSHLVQGLDGGLMVIENNLAVNEERSRLHLESIIERHLSSTPEAALLETFATKRSPTPTDETPTALMDYYNKLGNFNICQERVAEIRAAYEYEQASRRGSRRRDAASLQYNALDPYLIKLQALERDLEFAAQAVEAARHNCHCHHIDLGSNDEDGIMSEVPGGRNPEKAFRGVSS